MRSKATLLSIVALAIVAYVAIPQEPVGRVSRLSAISARVDLMLQSTATRAYKADQLARIHEQYIQYVNSGDDVLALYSEIVEARPDGGRLVVHGAPLRYRDQRGRLRAVNTTLVRNDKGVMRNEGANVTEFYPNGGVSIARDGVYISYIPAVFGFTGGGEKSFDLFDPKRKEEIECEQIATNEIEIRNLYPNGIVLRRTLKEWGVKESVILPEKPSIPEKATAFAIRNRYDVPPLCELVKRHNKLLVLDDAGRTMFRFVPMPVTDAAGNKTMTRYAVRDKTFTVEVDAEFLRKATYPVDIDPSTDTQAFEAMRYTSQVGEFGGIWLKIDLPGIDGTINDASLIMTVADSDNSAGSSTFALDATMSTDDSWTEATGATTMNAVSVGTTISSLSVDNDDPSATTYTWDLEAASTVQVSDFYAVCNPTYCTIRLYNASKTGTGSGGGDITIEWNSGDYIVELAGYSNVTSAWRPKLTIDYTGSLGCSPSYVIQGGAGAGVLIF